MANQNSFFFGNARAEESSAVTAQGAGAGLGNNYLTGLSFNTSNGNLTAQMLGLPDIVTNLDGRYRTTAQTLSFVLGELTITDGNTVDLDSRYYTESEVDSLVNGVATYAGWTISDGSNSELIGSSDTLTITGTGTVTSSYDAISNTLTLFGTSPDLSNYAVKNADNNFSADQTFATNVTVTGNLTVNGTQFITNTETVEIEDNLLIINNGEVGTGITAALAGIEVDRGLATNYQFVFEESSDLFKIGTSGNLQAVATRPDSPTNEHYARWNTSNNSLEFVDDSSIDAGSVGGLTVLNIADFDLTSFANNEYPKYNSSTQQFEGTLIDYSEIQNTPTITTYSFDIQSNSDTAQEITNGETIKFVDGINTTVTTIAGTNEVQINVTGLTAETLQTVTNRGATTTQDIQVATLRANSDAIYIGNGPQLTIQKSGGNFSIVQSGSGFSGYEIQLARSGETTRVLGDLIVDEGATINGFTTVSNSALQSFLVTGTNATATDVRVGNTSTGNARILLDGSNGDFAGGDFTVLEDTGAGYNLYNFGSVRYAFTVAGGHVFTGNLSTTGAITENGAVNINASNFSTYFNNALNVTGNIALTDDPNNFSVNQVFDAGLTNNGVATFNNTAYWNGTENFIWWSGTDFIARAGSGKGFAIQTNGNSTDRLVVDAAGNTTINGGLTIDNNGTTEINGSTIKLNTNDVISSSSIEFNDSNGTAYRLTSGGFTNGAFSLVNLDTSAELMRVTSGGTATINGDIVLEDNISFTGTTPRLYMTPSTGGFAEIRFGDSTDTDRGEIQYDNTTNLMSFRANAIDLMKIGSSEIDVNTQLVINRSAGGLVLRDSNDTGSSAAPYMQFEDETEFRLGYIGFGSSGNSHLFIHNDNSDGHILFRTNATTRWEIDETGILSGSYNLTTTGTIAANGGDSDDWNSAFGWGNHALQGYLTSPDLADYLDLTSTGTQTMSGNLSVYQINLGEYLTHNGDSNTYLRFTSDRIRLFAGGDKGLDIFENSSGIFNGYGGDYNTSYGHYFYGTANFTGDISGNFIGTFNGASVVDFARLDVANNFEGNMSFDLGGSEKVISGNVRVDINGSGTFDGNVVSGGNLLASSGYLKTDAPTGNSGTVIDGGVASPTAENIKFGSVHTISTSTYGWSGRVAVIEIDGKSYSFMTADDDTPFT